MRKLILTLAFIYSGVLTAQVGIGTITPDTSAALDVSSTSQGVLLPRVTAFPAAPAEGLIVYRTDLHGFYAWNGTAWTQAVFTPATTVSNAISGNTVSTTVNGVAGTAVTLPNIYTANGTLTGARTISQAGNTLAFNASGVNAFSIGLNALSRNFSVDALHNSIGINTFAPDVNAALDINGRGQTGVLVPRIAINNLLLAAPLTAPVSAGMLVFSQGGTVADGFYYWTGTKWAGIAQKTLRDYSFNTSGATIPADTDRYTVADGDYAFTITLPDAASSNNANRINQLLTVYKISGYDVWISAANTDLPANTFYGGTKTIVFMFDGNRWVHLKTSN